MMSDFRPVWERGLGGEGNWAVIELTSTHVN